MCLHCKKEHTARMPNNRKFCSLDCYRHSPKPYKRTGMEKKCGVCEKLIWVTKSQNKKVNYCSVICHNISQSKKLEYVCKICGCIFKWSPSRIKTNNPKYCSIDCRNKCEEWKLNSVIKGNLVQLNSKKLNNLELLGNNILDEIGIEYQTQVLICEKFVVDVFIPSCNLIIQWDGDYWHGFKEIKDERQRKRSNLDKSQDSYMKKVGYKVIRFWEHEVKKEKEKVIENIRKAIQ